MRLIVIAALLALLLLPTAAAAAPSSEALQARGAGDLLDPAQEDETGASGTSRTPLQPTLVNLLVVGPALGLLVLGAWAATPLRGRDDEGSPGSPDGEAPSPAAPGSPTRPGTVRGSAPDDGGSKEGPQGSTDAPPTGTPNDASPGAEPAGEAEDDPHRPRDGRGAPSPEADREPDLEGLPTGGDLPGPDDLSETEPGVPRILRLGKAAVDEGDLEDAVEWFDTAIAADPDLGVAHLCRGLSLEEMGRHEDAADAFRSAAEADPGDVAARYLLARALAEAGEAREALVHLRQVLDLVPELADLARDDEGFQVLRDDPRFLAALGDL